MRKFLAALAAPVSAIILVGAYFLFNVVIQISPEDAASNVAHWFRAFGMRPPTLLESRNVVVWTTSAFILLSILFAWGLFGRFRQYLSEPAAVQRRLIRLKVEKLKDAAFGEGPEEHWIDKTTDGEPLVERVKQLIQQPLPARVNFKNLKTPPKFLEGVHKQLRLKFIDGTMILIEEGDPLRFTSATGFVPGARPGSGTGLHDGRVNDG